MVMDFGWTGYAVAPRRSTPQAGFSPEIQGAAWMSCPRGSSPEGLLECRGSRGTSCKVE